MTPDLVSREAVQGALGWVAATCDKSALTTLDRLYAAIRDLPSVSAPSGEAVAVVRQSPTGSIWIEWANKKTMADYVGRALCVSSDTPTGEK